MSSRTFIIVIVGMFFVVFFIAVNIVLSMHDSPTKHPEPVINKWDYKLTKIKDFKSTYGSALYQGNSGECYLRVNHHSTSSLSVVTCSDFMEIGNGQ